MYCPKCLHLTDDDRCTCGNKHLRTLRPDDLVHLLQTDALWASAVDDLLTQHHIPHTERSMPGAAITAYTGSWLERRSFYVRWEHYDAAKALTEDFFAPGDETDE